MIISNRKKLRTVHFKRKTPTFYSFIFTNSFILVRVALALEPILETISAKQDAKISWDTTAHTHFTYCGDLQMPVHLQSCIGM